MVPTPPPRRASKAGPESGSRVGVRRASSTPIKTAQPGKRRGAVADGVPFSGGLEADSDGSLVDDKLKFSPGLRKPLRRNAARGAERATEQVSGITECRPVTSVSLVLPSPPLVPPSATRVSTPSPPPAQLPVERTLLHPPVLDVRSGASSPFASPPRNFASVSELGGGGSGNGQGVDSCDQPKLGGDPPVNTNESPHADTLIRSPSSVEANVPLTQNERPCPPEPWLPPPPSPQIASADDGQKWPGENPLEQLTSLRGHIRALCAELASEVDNEIQLPFRGDETYTLSSAVESELSPFACSTTTPEIAAAEIAEKVESIVEAWY
eukprot:TRINITY_DN7137_c1_g1_i1.p1 TRINITY_DN7137_c1_g1~~TRINITY_DN7137_c1_g1_i1.p1  ORF type:complete len:377 (-),score=96.65 TRINITY_DN7137_c1_g1_i1:117-1091(-)